MHLHGIIERETRRIAYAAGEHTSSLMQSLPQSQGIYTSDTDAHDCQVLSVLLQRQPNGLAKPVSYRSQSLADEGHTCDTTYREYLSITWAILLLHQYFESTGFNIPTDSDALKGIQNLAETTCRLARWRCRLSEMEFDIVHHAGIKHQAADAVSCQFSTKEDHTQTDYLLRFWRFSQSWKSTKKKFPKPPTSLTTMMAMSLVSSLRDYQPRVVASALDHRWILLHQRRQNCYPESKRRILPRICSYFHDARLMLRVCQDGILPSTVLFDGVAQTVLPNSLRPCLLPLTSWPKLAGHLANVESMTTWHASSKARQCNSRLNNIQQLPKICYESLWPQEEMDSKLFPAIWPLPFTTIDIFGMALRMATQHQSIIFDMSLYSKLVHSISSL